MVTDEDVMSSLRFGDSINWGMLILPIITRGRGVQSLYYVRQSHYLYNV